MVLKHQSNYLVCSCLSGYYLHWTTLEKKMYWYLTVNNQRIAFFYNTLLFDREYRIFS